MEWAGLGVTPKFISGDPSPDEPHSQIPNFSHVPVPIQELQTVPGAASAPAPARIFKGGIFNVIILWSKGCTDSFFFFFPDAEA